MALTERLLDFPAKTTPTPSDIVYVGDAANSFEEVKCTIAQIIAAYPALASIGGLTTVANKIIYTSGVNTYATADLTAFMRGLLGSADGAAVMAAIGALALAGGTMTGTLLLSGTQTADTAAATVAFVKNLVQNVQQPALVSTTANLAGYTYANGASGVGATLTAGGNGAFSADGVSPALNSRVLVPFQSTTFQNGMYVLTTVGTAGTPAILTRATDYDEPAEIQAGDKFAVLSGTLYAGTEFLQTATVTTIGTDPITFQQMGNASYLVKGNNLSDLANLGTALLNLGGGTAPTGTGALVRQNQPTVNQANLVGVTTVSNAAAGSLGEVVTASVLFASAVSLTSNVAANLTSISLTAGDWDVYGNVFCVFNVGALNAFASINTTSATLPDTSLVNGVENVASTTNAGFNTPVRRINVSSTTTVYMVVRAVFSSGTGSVCGNILARRVR